MNIVQPEFLKLHDFIEERERIRKRKEAKEPRPWTEDPILQTFKFCNVWRQDDKTTAWIHDQTRSLHWGDAVLYFVWARIVNRTDTLSMIPPPRLGSLTTWPASFDFSKIKYSDAYIVLPNLPKGANKFSYVYAILEEIQRRLLEHLNYPPTGYLIQHTILKDLPRINGLILYEIMCDVWRYLAEPESYCNVGGGARPTLQKIMGKSEVGQKDIAFLTELLNRSIAPHEIWGELTWRCVEGSCCELRKYTNLKNDSKAKRRYYR